ncbi:S-layer homology domain-containing protein [Peptococcus simiae]|uniref:S-layer homology domain-containing protein n=1 Tax=Peptococcus simiae TaxID=1643805 RepID=UPI00397F7EFC
MKRLIASLLTLCILFSVIPSLPAQADKLVSDQSQPTQQVPIQVFKADKDVPSMASGAVEPAAQVTQVEEGWQVDITFKSMTVMGLSGHLEGAYVYDNLADMKAKNAKDLRKAVTVVDTYMDGDKNYPKTIRVVTKDKPTTIGLAVVVDIMKAMGGDGESNMRVVLNWPGDEPAVDPEKATAKADLDKAIAQAEAKLKDGKTYTDASKAALEKALSVAKAALDKDTAAMKAATEALTEALGQLKESQAAQKVPIKVFKAEEDKPSMASGAVNPEALVTRVAEGWQVDVTFKPMSVGEAKGHLEEAYTYDSLADMKAKNAKDLRKAVTVVSTYTDGEKEYPQTIRFVSKEKPTSIGLTVVVDMMKAIGGDGEANMRIVLDWPGDEPAVDPEKATAKADLDKAIAQAEAKLKDGKTYTDASKATLEKALSAAKAALDKDTAAMKAAAETLNKAIKGLTTKATNTPEEKELTVKAFIRHASKDQASMANQAFYPQVDVVEKGDEATYTLYFKTLPIQGQEGHIISISLDGQPLESVAGRDSTYQYGFRFTRPSLKEKELKLTFSVDMMAGVPQDAILVLNWSGKAQVPAGGSGSAAVNPDTEKQDLKDKHLKALVEEAEGLLKDKKYTDKDLSALKAAVQEVKAAKSEKEGEKAKKALIKALADIKKAKDKKEELPQKNQHKFTLTQPKAGYISGYPNGTFRPDQLVSRAEAAAMLAQFVLANQKADKLPKDVPADSWYTASMRTFIGAGLLSGYEDGTIGPDKAMTRAEMTALIVRMKGLEPYAGQYEDVLSSHWASPVIGAARQAGIVAGYPDGSFKPDQAVTRAEMVAMVNRAFAYTGSGSSRHFTDVTSGHWAYDEIQKAIRV